MIRRNDWQERLAEAVKHTQIVPFSYGVHDCCMWAAYCIDQMCDTDYVNQVVERLNYHSEAEANAVIANAGGLDNIVSEFLGEPIPGAFAAPGDVVLARNGDEKPIITVMVGHHLVGPGPDTVHHLPFSAAMKCWRV